MAVTAEVAAGFSPVVTKQRPLSEYPGPKTNIIGSEWIRTPQGWDKRFYYDGNPKVAGAQEVQGITGTEWVLGQLPTVNRAPETKIKETTIVTKRHLQVVR